MATKFVSPIIHPHSRGGKQVNRATTEIVITISKKWIRLALMLCAPLGAQGAIITYTSQPSFIAAAASSATDTFEDLAPQEFLSGALARSVGNFGYEADALLEGVSSNLFAAPDTTGISTVWLSTDVAVSILTLSGFTDGINGIGGNFFATDFAGAVAPVEIVVTATFVGGSITQPLSSQTPDSFVGFFSENDQLLSFTVASNGQSGVIAWPAVDDITMVGLPVPVPVPGTMYPMLLALGIITCMRGDGLRRWRSAVGACASRRVVQPLDLTGQG